MQESLEAEPEPSSSSGGTESTEMESNCTICGVVKLTGLLDLSSNHVMQRRLSRDWKMPTGVIQSTLKAICVECVCKLNVHSEVTHSLRQRMQRLQRPATGNVITTNTLTIPEIPPIADAKVSSTLMRSSSSCSELEAYSCQPPESPSATESGGLRDSQSLHGGKWRTRLVCQHCGRAFFRKDYFNNHSRRCWRQRTQRRRSKAKCRVLNEAEDEQDEDDEEEDFVSLNSLTEQQRYSCRLCEEEFDTKYGWELHYTICCAQQEALMDKPQRKTRSQQVEKDLENENEVEDDLYLRRMNFTGDWIANHSRSNSYEDYVQEEESPITTEKEYDLYLLDVLKNQIQLKSFTCFARSCGYESDTLLDMMMHDYMHHWKMSWFYCHKCGDVFTSKVFLDYHLDGQNRGLYICHKCEDKFELQHQLDRHLLLHRKNINHHCKFCRMAFLSKAKLFAHCQQQGHSPNDEPLIRIDRQLSFSNPLPPVKKPMRPPFEQRELSIPFVPMPSLRPMHLPNHKPFRFAIGIVHFDHRLPPNCVGCQ